MDSLPRADLDSRGSRARGNRHRRAGTCTYGNLRSTTYAYRNTDCHCDIIPRANYDACRYSNQHAFNFPFANAYSHAHGNAVANAHSGTYLDSNQHTDAIAYSDSHSYPGR